VANAMDDTERKSKMRRDGGNLYFQKFINSILMLILVEADGVHKLTMFRWIDEAQRYFWWYYAKFLNNYSIAMTVVTKISVSFLILQTISATLHINHSIMLHRTHSPTR
jgi:hypothetical protein